ncbi:hypothetical protein [Clostridium akagii]|nr:hypothetical protein [Clostridium akagii]
MMKNGNGKIIIAQTSPQLPAWIWTDKNVEEQDYKELAMMRGSLQEPHQC